MISLILTQKILSLYVILLMGFLLVRMGLLKSEDSRVLSAITLWLVSPCNILTAFEVDVTPEVVSGLALAFLAAALIHVLLLLLNIPMKKLGMDAVERVSVIYSNAGNLVIPLVTSLFRQEWVIYCCGFMSVQLFFIWSHGKSAVCGELKPDIRKVLTSVNMISVFAGFAIFLSGFRFPAFLQDSMESVSKLMGPFAMLVTGMLIGGRPLKELLRYPRMPLVVCLRLIAVPLIVVCLLKFTPLAGMSPNGHTVLMISLIAAMTPSASTVTQMCVYYQRDAGYASAINVFTTLCCILTMPVMLWLYQL